VLTGIEPGATSPARFRRAYIADDNRVVHDRVAGQQISGGDETIAIARRLENELLRVLGLSAGRVPAGICSVMAGRPRRHARESAP
jgi:hypothetical protein